MTTKVTGLRRLAFGVAASALATAVALPALSGQAYAYGQVQNRYIQMSSSASGSGASGQGVTYHISFDAATGSAVKGIAVDFCDDTPIIGTSCNRTNVPDIGGTPNVSGGVTVPGMTGGTWSASSAHSNHTLLLANSGATGTVSATSTITIDLSAVTNPTSAGIFYARIFTFAADTDPATWSSANSGDGSSTTNVVDAGGVALAVTAEITVTAKVQESLTFCVYTTSCGSGSAVALGNTAGVLASTTTMYTGTSKWDLASNASHGVTVRLKGDTLKSGSNSITAFGASCTADDAATAATEQFGLRLSTVGAGQSAVSPYNCGANNHGLDVTTACSSGEGNVTCTYGDVVATTAAANDSSTTTVEYSAKAGSATEAGIYTATMNYIATGKY